MVGILEEVNELLESVLMDMMDVHGLSREEVDLIRVMCMYKVSSLEELKSVMNEVDYYRAVRGFDRNWGKKRLLEEVLGAISEL